MAKTKPASSNSLKKEVQDCAYLEEHICELLQIRDVPLAKPQDLPSYFQRLQQANNVTALSTAFWLLHQHGRRKQIAELIGAENLAQLEEQGFVQEVAPGVVETEHLLEAPLWDRLRVRCPTLAIRGAGSAVFPRANMEHLCALIEGARGAEIEADHRVSQDNPEGLAALLDGFIGPLETA